ncbi:glycoside hydrolase family 32 protein [Xylocopilactobacillus apicola]|uniref:Sucrose-6-phosphate hydrolase n=1 Tax=Xylocopilactobacillus apicola TaxID=2932184 RepID=A0AAU9DAJ2_9LACO|nr:sucrose-6-phosphate hydrolase [Xylocopilactobacillus apicola]BDR58533.1 invertase [Xylocopilactobacillus apicola]BDR58555.1 invertase [Xylocopilactobacillus apicola]
MTEVKKLQELSDLRYRLGYHLMAPSGWINDPNGFCYFKGYYHIFYQYHPYSSEWGPMHWGHARSRDLLHWETLPIALTPGDSEDKDGCFSGSAIVKDDVLYLIYTGNNYYDDGDPEHYWQNQNLAFSQDGIHFTKYEKNPIIATPPKDNTKNFRDPKVWERDGLYYLAVGSQNNDQLGRLLVYRSDDLKTWEYLGAVAKAISADEEGYMWECPDLFRLNGQDFLLTSPQGIVSQAEKYLNIHQSGYFVGEFDYENNIFRHGQFNELDQGHDFYAPQTMLTPDGRRIAIGWLNMWRSDMPEQKDGWAGALTLPRELVERVGQIYQQPIAEMKSLRQKTLREGNISVHNSIELVSGYSQLEINLKMDLQEFQGTTFTINFEDSNSDSKVELKYQREQNKFILKRSDRSDARYAKLKMNDQLEIQIFVDKSSLEIFLNQGESVFTDRYYFNGTPKICLTSEKNNNFDCAVYQLPEKINTYQICK